MGGLPLPEHLAEQTSMDTKYNLPSACTGWEQDKMDVSETTVGSVIGFSRPASPTMFCEPPTRKSIRRLDNMQILGLGHCFIHWDGREGEKATY